MHHPDQPKHYCGVFGIYGHPNAAELTYYGLYALQHRGQESAGIVTCADGRFCKHHGMGLVPQIFTRQILHDHLLGNMGVGHTRYSTTGSSHLRNAQPLTVDCKRGQIAVAHNGNLTNAAQLRDELESRGLVFQTNVDSEIIIMMLAQPEINGQPNNLVASMRRLEGAYSLVIMTQKELIGVRDPHGFRPLSLGRKDGAWVLASETCVFEVIGAKFERDIEPGEIVIINEQGLTSVQAFPEHQRRAFCIFEYVYFARPDSVMDGTSVYESRLRMGEYLAEKIRRQCAHLKIDVVIPIPDTSRPSAMQLAFRLGLPYREGFIKNRYIGRTFIMPGQSVRKKSVRQKLNAMPMEFKGKNVLLVDDSIVRGTTSKEIIQMARDAGAAAVYFASASPPVRYPNVYGIDMPTRRELLANGRSDEEIALEIGADAVVYQDLADLIAAVRSVNPRIERFDASCFDGCYITGDVSEDYLARLEGQRDGGAASAPSPQMDLNLATA